MRTTPYIQSPFFGAMLVDFGFGLDCAPIALSTIYRHYFELKRVIVVLKTPDILHNPVGSICLNAFPI